MPKTKKVENSKLTTHSSEPSAEEHADTSEMTGVIGTVLCAVGVESFGLRELIKLSKTCRFFDSGLKREIEKRLRIRENIQTHNCSTLIASGLTYPVYDYHLNGNTLIVNSLKEIVSWDLDKNKENWKITASEISGESKIKEQLFVCGDYVVCKFSGDTFQTNFVVLSYESGKILHSFVTHNEASSITLDDYIISYDYKEEALHRWSIKTGDFIDSHPISIKPKSYGGLYTHKSALYVNSRHQIVKYKYLENEHDDEELVVDKNLSSTSEIGDIKFFGNYIVALMHRRGEAGPDIVILNADNLDVIYQATTDNIFYYRTINYPHSPQNPGKCWNWVNLNDVVFDSGSDTAYVIDEHGILVKFDFKTDTHKVLDRLGDGLYKMSLSNEILSISTDKNIILYDTAKEEIIKRISTTTNGYRFYKDNTLFYSQENAVLIRHDYDVSHSGELLEEKSEDCDAVSKVERDCCVM